MQFNFSFPHSRTRERGFIALISSVIISSILLGLALSVGGGGVFARLDVLNSEYKRISLGLAESCENVALLKIAQNYSYQVATDPAYNAARGGAVVPIAIDAQGRIEDCVISSVTYGTENTVHQKIAKISTSAQYPGNNGAFSSVTVSASVQNPAYPVPARGSLTVIFNVTNDDGGIKQPADFTVTINASNPTPSTFAGASGSGVLVLMDAGSYNYTLTPASMPGYTITPSANCTGTMTAGGTQTCTFTANDVPTTATLTVTANVLNFHGGTKQPSDFPLFIDGVPAVSGVPVKGLAPGAHTVTASAPTGGYTVSNPQWGYDCTPSGSITLAVGNNKTCIVTFADPAPASLACADSVMILDRTGSLFGANADGPERDAAIALVRMYEKVTPVPNLGVGSIGAYPNASLPAGAANVNASGQMGTSLVSLENWIATIMTNSSSVGSNLAAGIIAGNAELNRMPPHVDTKDKVLIFVGDGAPNEPSGTISTDTGFKSPTADMPNNLIGDAWSSPSGAYGGGDANDALGHRHQYLTFGLPVIPSGATVTGIEVKTDAWSSAFSSAATLLSDTFGTGNTSTTVAGWTEQGTGTQVQAPALGDDTASPDGGRFALIDGNGGTICQSINAVGSTGLTLSYYWRGDTQSTQSSDLGVVEYKTSGNCGDTTGWTQLKSHDMRTFAVWTTQSAFGLPVSNTNFLLRFRAATNSSTEDFRIDKVVVSGTQSSTCILGVDLSWNSGASWSSEDTQVLTTTSQSYTLNGPWTGHTWVPGDFDPTANKFRVRIHDTNAGATCHVDTLQARVLYNTTADPVEAALSAADAAKLQGDPLQPANKTQIFSIFFGTDTSGAGKTLMAKLASGTTLVTGHQPGSAFDQSITPVTGDTGYKPAGAAVTGGQWTAAGNALASDNTYTTDAVANHTQAYGTFGLSVPAGVSVKGVEVSVEAKSSDNSGCQVGAELSTDNGSTFTTSGYITAGSIASTDTVYPIGGSASLWGRTFYTTDFADGKFVVRLKNIHTTSCTSNATLSVDQVRVRVYYSTIPENVDGDNFFVSPSSSDMADIFYAIGAKVCPAAVAPPAAAPPTQGTVIVITHVVNDNGGVNQAADFTVNVSGINPSQTSFQGSESPGIAIQMDPNPSGPAFSITQGPTGLPYSVAAPGPGCSGTITAGQVLTCTLTNDDLAPTTGSASSNPAVPGSVNIGSWQETP